jgi:hypothetical protein
MLKLGAILPPQNDQRNNIGSVLVCDMVIILLHMVIICCATFAHDYNRRAQDGWLECAVSLGCVWIGGMQ